MLLSSLIKWTIQGTFACVAILVINLQMCLWNSLGILSGKEGDDLVVRDINQSHLTVNVPLMSVC